MKVDRLSRHDAAPRRRRGALAVVLLGSCLAGFNMSTVGLSLTAVERDLGASSALSIDWVITAFLLGTVLMLPVAAWAADGVGKHHVHTISLVFSAVGTATCAVAPSLEVMLVGRLVQGFGAGSLVPIGMALVYGMVAPSRRGRVLGLWGLGMAAVPAIGPPLVGWIITAAGWRAMFASFAAVSSVACLLSHRVLFDDQERRRRSFDLIGWLLGAAGISALLVSASRIAGAPSLVGPLVIGGIGVVLILAMSLHNRRVVEPIIDLALFRNRRFSTAVGVAVLLLGVAQYARLTFLPVELEQARGMSAAAVGALLAPAAIGVAIAMPLGGHLSDRFGPRWPAVGGALMVAVSAWGLGGLDETTSIRWIIVLVALQGAGTGVAYTPVNKAVLDSLPVRQTAESSMLSNLTRQLGAAIGLAALWTLVQSRVGTGGGSLVEVYDAYNSVFRAISVVAAAALIISLALDARPTDRDRDPRCPFPARDP